MENSRLNIISFNQTGAEFWCSISKIITQNLIKVKKGVEVLNKPHEIKEGIVIVDAYDYSNKYQNEIRVFKKILEHKKNIKVIWISPEYYTTNNNSNESRFLQTNLNGNVIDLIEDILINQTAFPVTNPIIDLPA